MHRILDIQVQKLFLLTLILKIGSSFLGWYFQYQWTLGFIAPLVIMLIYIFLGIKRHDTDVTDEKFADSCYYLGFIFTMTSIIFSLFDLPNIGMKIQDIAVRFGAAMVSTVLGLGVRVYLVSFTRDAADAIKDTEDTIIEASRKLQEQLVLAFEKLRAFDFEVDNAAKLTIERVNKQMESFSKNQADKLADFFVDLTDRNQKAFTLALEEVKTASLRLSNSVDDYSLGMRENLTSIEAKVTVFTEAISDRLRTTIFPDEYFAKHLEAPLAQLTTSTNAVSGSIKTVASEVNDSSEVLTGALKKLRSKSKSTEGALDKVINLTAQQQTVLDTAEGQVTVLGHLTETLAKFDGALSTTIARINVNNEISSELASRIESVVAENIMNRQIQDSNFTAMANEMKINANMAAAVVSKLEENAFATQLVAQKLDKASILDTKLLEVLGVLGHQAANAINNVDQTSGHLESMVQQLSSLDSTLRNHSVELKYAVDSIKNLEISGDLPSFISTTSPHAALNSPPQGQKVSSLTPVSQSV